MGRPATLRVDIVTNAKTQGVSQAESKLGSFGSKAKSVGKAAAVGLAAVGAAAVAVGAKVAESASRQQQAYGALDSIYGKHSATVKRWAANAATSVGLARSQYAELSSVVGSQLQAMGMETAKSAKTTDQLIKKGADLAATFGGSVTDAVSAVSSLLKGERDPIERYGVSIKQADIEARKAKLGLDGLTGAAAKQAEAQAVLSLLNEQTAKTTGQFSRESNTLAGQQERLKAKFENVKATVGSKLTPVLTVLFTWVNDKLFPAAGKLGQELGSRLGPIINKVASFVREQLVPRFRELWSWIQDKLVPAIRATLGPILEGLKAVLGTVASAVARNSDKFAGFGAAVLKLWEKIQPLRELLAGGLKLALQVVAKALGPTIDAVATLVGWVGDAVSVVADLVGWLSNLANSAGGAVLDKLSGFFAGSPLELMVAPRTTGLGGLGLGPALATSGLATGASSSSWESLTAPSSSTRPAAYIDRRDFSVTVKVDGALDAPAVARQLEELLRRHRQAVGRESAYRGVMVAPA